jgi:hypothetical protein
MSTFSTHPSIIHRDDDWTAENNAALMQALITGGDKNIKQAADGASDYVRRILRESSFHGAILPVKTITYGDMTRIVSNAAGDSPEIGVVQCEMEPGSPASRTVSFSAAPVQNTYRGDVFFVPIGKDETPELYKSVDELGLYKMDLRQVVTDNVLKDLDNLADYRLIQSVKDVTGSDPDVFGQGGYQQYREVTGGITRTNYAQTRLPLQDATLNNGVFLLSRQTANDFLTWGRDEVGGDLAQELLLKGTNALESFTIMGVPHVASIKASLLPKGMVFHFAPSNFLGRFFELQPPTVFVKKERSTITVYAERKYGYHLANTAAMARTNFLS